MSKRKPKLEPITGQRIAMFKNQLRRGVLIASDAYGQSEGSLTCALKAIFLDDGGPAGRVAWLLFKAQKASSRAKKYGPQFKGKSYDRKNEGLRDLAQALTECGAQLEITWGWSVDDKATGFTNVLYVDLPTGGQCSFHSGERYIGPDYTEGWSGVKDSAQRICTYCNKILIDVNSEHVRASENQPAPV